MYIQFGLLHVELNIAQWWLIEGNPCNGGCGTVFTSACVSSEWYGFCYGIQSTGV